MVTINGITIKKDKIVYVKGIDVLTADVYKDGIKLGEWQEDGEGGDDYFSFDERELDEAVEKYKNSLPDGYIMKKICGKNIFLTAIHNLKKIEKQVNAYWKEHSGDTVYIVDNGFTITILTPPSNYTDNDVHAIIENTKNKMSSDYGHDNLKCIVRKFSSKQDFNIVC